jgi:hypothetical protein
MMGIFMFDTLKQRLIVLKKKYFEYADNNTDDDTNYKTDVNNLTCTCKDWIETRKSFDINDPRRICKHLLAELDIESMPNKLDRFYESFKYYKEKGKGFKSYFDEIIEIPNSDIVVCYSGLTEWSDVFENRKRYGFLHFDYNNKMRWAQDDKPHNYDLVERFFRNNNKYHPPIKPTDTEIKELVRSLSMKFPKINFNNFDYTNSQYSPTEYRVTFDIIGIPLEIRDGNNVHDVFQLEVYKDRILFVSYTDTLIEIIRQQ